MRCHLCIAYNSMHFFLNCERLCPSCVPEPPMPCRLHRCSSAFLDPSKNVEQQYDFDFIGDSHREIKIAIYKKSKTAYLSGVQ